MFTGAAVRHLIGRDVLAKILSRIEHRAGFEQGVRGMAVGETRTVEIETDDAYGPRNDALVNTVAREGMRLEHEPEVGMSLLMQLPDGNQIPLTVTGVTDTHVTLDANHPLAGEKLIFEIELLEIV